jgi:hypothetical protein
MITTPNQRQIGGNIFSAKHNQRKNKHLQTNGMPLVVL